MKKYWRQMTAAVLAVLLLLLGLDIRFGILSGPGCRLPVLMYHHFTDNPELGTMVSSQQFREQMTALKEAGFTAVTLKQVQDYVAGGPALPAKPILITMDDGYTSNLTIAAPILEELGYCATIFCIGFYEGEVLDLRTGNPIWEDRFSYEEALPWVEKGVLNIQSHSFDMHRLIEDGEGSLRDGMLPMDGESDVDYRQAIKNDLEQARQRREGRISSELNALAYPYGYWTDELDQILEEEGIVFTFTIIGYSNRLCVGDPDCLREMGRFNVTDDYSGQYLVRRMERALRGGA